MPNDATLVHVFVAHTTAAITVMDLDPGTDLDFLDALDGLLPNLNWQQGYKTASFEHVSLLFDFLGNS